MLNQSEKAKFILALHKHSLAAFDTGGTAQNMTTQVQPTTGFGADVGKYGTEGTIFNPSVISNVGNAAVNVAQPLGQTATGIGAAFTDQNQYQANNPYDTSVLGSAVGNTGQVYGQEQGLTGQLAAESQGRGPNPAAMEVQQAQQQNAATANSIAQSQRGANPGLAARDASLASTASNQQIAGQGAALQAQQQLAAQGQEATALQNQGQQQLQQQSLYNNANEYSQGINAQTAQSNTNAVNTTTSGIFGGASSALSSLLAKGGFVSRYDDGGAVSIPAVNVPNLTPPASSSSSSGGGGGGAGIGALLALLAPGGKVEPMGPVGKMLKHGKFSPKLAAKGGKVIPNGPGQAAVKKDNSFANDKVPALLSSGEIVIPRSITMHPMAPQMAAQFVQAALNKRKMGGSK